MSVEILETIKEQTKALTPQERKILVDYLVNKGEETKETDLGLKGETEEEKRHLRDAWMKSDVNRQKYGGLYVALDGDKLLGTGKNYPEAARRAREANVRDAFIDFLPPPGYVGEMGGW